MSTGLRAYVMPSNRRWNALGVPLPLWFRRSLRRIDRRLTVQYMPPATVDPAGVNPAHFPYGLWTVCRKMPRTGWLHSRWVMGLFDEKTGRPRQPRRSDLAAIVECRNHWRRQRSERITDEFDRACKEMMRSNTESAKCRSMERIAQCMRKHDFTQYGGRRIRVPG